MSEEDGSARSTSVMVISMGAKAVTGSFLREDTRALPQGRRRDTEGAQQTEPWEALA